MIEDREGWSIYDQSAGLVIYTYQEGYISVDFKNRCWALGQTWRPKLMGTVYRGKGWKERLERDVIKALEAIYKEK